MKILDGHPVPWSITVQRDNGITFKRLQGSVFVRVVSYLRDRGMKITRIEGGYVFYECDPHRQEIHDTI